MDGWAHGSKPEVSAIDAARTPFVDSLYSRYPNSELITHSEWVGLPRGQMGNSEVGHINIGAGRVVNQELMRINAAISDGSFYKNKTLADAFRHAAGADRTVHIAGLVSDGGIHSHTSHLHALCRMARESGIRKLFIHAFTDGRDTDPRSGLRHISGLLGFLRDTPYRIATVTGRYYAMDRDKRWERIKLAYDAMVHGEGASTRDIPAAMTASYDAGITDEFIRPIIAVDDGLAPLATISEGDVFLCFNFRTDRCRQITAALTQEDIPAHGMKKLALYYVTMTTFDAAFKGIKVVFNDDHVKMTLGEVLANEGKSQVRIAETEKYPHVTYFFSGGREEPFTGERRILIPSPKVATYDLKPEMSAYLVKDAVIKEINENEPDFICLNYANPDMVGHTGVFSAAVKAVETTDQCVRETAEAALARGYVIFLTADHGNADFMVNDDGTPNTAHTMNPVPLFVIGYDGSTSLKDGKLGDIAPTILKVMGISIPAEMTGDLLL